MYLTRILCYTIPMATFSINEALKVGWQKAWKNVWLWVGVMITTGVINMLLGRVGDSTTGDSTGLVISLAGFIVQVIIEIGILTIALRLLDNQPVKYTDLFLQYHLLGQFLIAVIIISIAVGVGLILFIIPGIYIGLRLSQACFIIVDQKLSGIEAIKKSWAITKGHTLKLFLLVIVMVVINIIGALVLFIGLLVTLPTTTMAMAYVYRRLVSGAAALEVAPPAALSTTPAPQV